MEEFYNRRKKIFELMEDNTIAVFFSGKMKKRTSVSFYDFFPDSSFFYFTGINTENTAFIIYKKENKFSEVFFLPEDDRTKEKWTGKIPSAESITLISGIKDIQCIINLNEYTRTIVKENKIKKLYIEYSDSEEIFDMDLSRIFAEQIKKDTEIDNVENIKYGIGEIRKVKSPSEVESIRKAVDISKEAIHFMIKHIKPGMTEYEIESHYDFIVKNSGAGSSFESIIAAGKNAVFLHYTQNTDKANSGDLVLCDTGVIKDFYCSDITRTYPVNGKFTSRQKKLYNIVLNTNKEIIKISRPGITLVQLNEKAKEILYRQLKDADIIEDFSDLDKYYYHNVSHFLGIDVHDPGDREKPLEPGCVITVEPGIYIAEEGIGIRIEDNILITQGEAIVLSNEIPKEINEIEKIMSSN